MSSVYIRKGEGPDDGTEKRLRFTEGCLRISRDKIRR
jgi:hypothetical protein